MKYLLIGIILFFAACNGGDVKEKNNNKSSEASVTKGETLFKTNCTVCHKPNAEYTGPALKGADSRWPNKNNLYDFVRNPQSVIPRDAYAKALFEKYNEAPMTPFPQLSNDDIDAILTYCNNYKGE